MKTSPLLNRRQALALALSALASAGAMSCGLQSNGAGARGSQSSAPGVPGGPSSAPAKAPLRNQIAEPPVRSSVDGVLETTLTVEEKEIEIGGQRVLATTYEGSLPGPTLRVRPGDTLRIKLVNRLNEDTNLHVHGLHVSPSGNADNVFVTVPAGESFDYEYDIPADHAPGTYWYHPHLHHLSADQLFRGLAGVIVVEDGADQAPEIVAAVELTLVLKDITIANGLVPGATMMDMMEGREGSTVMVNGQVLPTIPIRPGEVQRWRVVNGGGARYYRFSVSGHEMYQIASDGGPLAAPRALTEVLLPPGKRVEVLVRGGATGEHAVSALAFDRNAGMGMGMGRGFMGRNQAATGPVQLATLVVGGDAASMALPARLAGDLTLPAAEVVNRRRLTLTEQMGAPGMRFFIDGKQFDATRVDQAVKLGTVEEWTIINRTTMDHPFHIHVNPFLVVGENGRAVEPTGWEDTVNVPMNGSITFRTRFRDFTGKAVYHCHILDHEDMGMMGVFEVS